jgi:hypothetical protein
VKITLDDALIMPTCWLLPVKLSALGITLRLAKALKKYNVSVSHRANTASVARDERLLLVELITQKAG